MFQYGVLDTARDRAIYPLVQQCSNYQCLFAGDIEPPLDSHAPYVVELKDGEPIVKQWREHWEQCWGIFVESEKSLTYVRRQLRKILTVELPDGSSALFRYYDPRVFRTALQNESDELFLHLYGSVHDVIFWNPDNRFDRMSNYASYYNP